LAWPHVRDLAEPAVFDCWVGDFCHYGCVEGGE
jgi:hypothetical protein